MVVLDTTNVNVALPSIQRGLRFSSDADLQWVVNACILVFATARLDAVKPAHPTPAALAAATTSSWAWAFIAGGALLATAALTANLLLRGRGHRCDRTHPRRLQCPSPITTLAKEV